MERLRKETQTQEEGKWVQSEDYTNNHRMGGVHGGETIHSTVSGERGNLCHYLFI